MLRLITGRNAPDSLFLSSLSLTTNSLTLLRRLFSRMQLTVHLSFQGQLSLLSHFTKARALGCYPILSRCFSLHSQTVLICRLVSLTSEKAFPRTPTSRSGQGTPRLAQTCVPWQRSGIGSMPHRLLCLLRCTHHHPAPYIGCTSTN